MRRPLAEYREQITRGFRIPRTLPSMVLMMAIVGVLMYNASRPQTWRFFGVEADGAVEVPAEDQSHRPAKSQMAQAAVPAKSDIPNGGPPAKTQPPKTEQAKAEATKSVAPAAAKTAAPTKGDEGKAAAPQPAPAEAEPVATGPTDLDESEQQIVFETRDLIEDGTLGMSGKEMALYRHVLSWVNNQPLALLRKRALKQVVYNDFIARPEDMRFKLVELDVQVRRIIPIIKTKDMEELPDLYEVWGFSGDSGSLLYTAIVVGLPEGMPTGFKVQERARLVGYFFKLQGYHSGESPPEVQAGRNARIAPLKAPVIMGRLVWVQMPKVEEASTPPWVWGVLSIIGAVVVISVVVMISIRGKKMPADHRLLAISPRNIDPEAVSVDEWLDQAQGSNVISGNNSQRSNESNSGLADHRPEGPGSGKPPASLGTSTQ